MTKIKKLILLRKKKLIKIYKKITIKLFAVMLRINRKK